MNIHTYPKKGKEKNNDHSLDANFKRKFQPKHSHNNTAHNKIMSTFDFL